MEKKDFSEDFYKAILTLKSADECRKFFSDACTPKEIHAISQRYIVAKMLNEKCVYNEIVEATGASTATISRVNRSINDGYALVFSRLNK